MRPSLRLRSERRMIMKKILALALMAVMLLAVAVSA